MSMRDGEIVQYALSDSVVKCIVPWKSPAVLVIS